MKKKYSKPTIAVESLTMSQPIAANCEADFDDMQDLIGFGYFGTNDRGVTCSFEYNEDEKLHDTICYHSNVQTAFLS